MDGSKRGRCRRRVVAAGLWLLLGMAPVGAQTGSSQTPQLDRIAPERGFVPGGSYRLSEIETVNTKNGNVLLRVPLASLPPGRGASPGFQLSLNYDNNLWDLRVLSAYELDSDSTTLLVAVSKDLGPALGNPGWSYNYE